MNGLAKAVILALIATYPVLVFFGLQVLPLHLFGALLITLAVARLVILRAEPRSPGQSVTVLALIGIAGYASLTNNPEGYRYYPVVVNTVLFAVFCHSLYRGTPVIERIARLQEPDLPDHAIHYTRVVTRIWAGFFLLNGLMAWYTATFTSMAVWALYNGCLAYLLIATLFAGEWLVRRELRRKWDAPAG